MIMNVMMIRMMIMEIPNHDPNHHPTHPHQHVMTKLSRMMNGITIRHHHCHGDYDDEWDNNLDNEDLDHHPSQHHHDHDNNDEWDHD